MKTISRILTLVLLAIAIIVSSVNAGGVRGRKLAQNDFRSQGLFPLDTIQQEMFDSFVEGGKGSGWTSRKPALSLGDAKRCCNNHEGEHQPKAVLFSEWTSPKAKEALANGKELVIPCGTHVILDVSPPQLKGLRIEGKLSVADDVMFDLTLKTDYIYNCGEFEIGTKKNKFQSNVTIELTGANELKGFGYKAFATKGGIINFNGSQCNEKVWTTLSQSAKAKTNQIHLSESVNNWNVGDKIMVASTDYSNARASETVTIKSIVNNGKTINLEEELNNNHEGVYPITAEVALLTRNIVIKGEDSCALENNVLSRKAGRCGHFVISQTNQGNICGVELTNMGQTGITGRYPLHFHFAGKCKNCVAKSNAIHNNHHRGIVIHATSDGTFEDNIIYNSHGHLLMTEDGLEENNIIKNNVIGVTKGVKWNCPQKHALHKHGETNTSSAIKVYKPNPKLGEWGQCNHRCSHGTGIFADLCGARSDDNGGVAGMWISNPNNIIVGNHVFTSVADAAIRMENRGITGLSAGLPKNVKISQVGGGRQGKNFKWKNMGTFDSNVVHSSSKGLKNYPHYTPSNGVHINNLISWKNSIGLKAKNVYKYDNPLMRDGKNGRKGGRYTLSNSLFVGNRISLTVKTQKSKVHVVNSVFSPVITNLINDGKNSANEIHEHRILLTKAEAKKIAWEKKLAARKAKADAKKIAWEKKLAAQKANKKAKADAKTIAWEKKLADKKAKADAKKIALEKKLADKKAKADAKTIAWKKKQFQKKRTYMLANEGSTKLPRSKKLFSITLDQNTIDTAKQHGYLSHHDYHQQNYNVANGFVPPETIQFKALMGHYNKLVHANYCDENKEGAYFLPSKIKTDRCDVHPVEFKKPENHQEENQSRLLLDDDSEFNDDEMSELVNEFDDEEDIVNETEEDNDEDYEDYEDDSDDDDDEIDDK